MMKFRVGRECIVRKIYAVGGCFRCGTDVTCEAGTLIRACCTLVVSKARSEHLFVLPPQSSCRCVMSGGSTRMSQDIDGVCRYFQFG